MTENFESLANAIKRKLEIRFGKKQIEGNYIYCELERLIREWTTGKFTSDRTDIGIAAVKLFDSDLPGDSELVDELCNLANIYRRTARSSKKSTRID